MQSQPCTSRTLDRADSIFNIWLPGIKDNNIQEQPDAEQSASNSNTQFDIVNEIQRNTRKNETPQKKEKEPKQKNKYVYQKRPGTSGICGQLYETKLLTLILLRALNNNDIIEFLLGTNIYDLGAMDDIVLRYKKKYSQKSKIIFIQAKHREDTNKEKLTLEDIFKANGDFSFQKYLQSYLKILQILHSGKNNQMFQNQNDVECDFIIYTPITQNIPTSKILQSCDCDVETLINTSENGKVFKFKYDDEDVERLLVSVRKSRVILLAKSVAKNIVQGNFRNIMKIDIIKQYHVYLAQNVLLIEDSETIQKVGDLCVSNKENCYYNGKFRESFLTSSDENLLLMKQVLCEELGVLKNTQMPMSDEVDNKLKDICFKLPVDFGNRVFCFYGSNEKQQRRLNHMCSIFTKLFQNIFKEDINYKYVKLDESSIGPDKIIQAKDLGVCWLGGLVGNLLINDHLTKALKFNLSEESLSADNIKILSQLKEQHDLSKFRFDINIYELPKLTLYSIEHDKILIRDFLSKLKFYTNQAKEDEVENVIKNEIKFYHLQQIYPDSLLHIKSDLIYLTFHDKVQRWWKQPHSAFYLTENCQFYKQAEQYVLSSPLIKVINYIYRKELENIFLQFDFEAIKTLQLDEFLKSDEKVLVIITDETNFSSIKLIQYFDSIQKSNDCIFIDLDSMIAQKSLETLKHDIKLSASSVLVVTSQEQSDIDRLHDKVKQIIELFKGKIILIMSSRLENDLKIMFYDKKIQKDNKNTFKNLSSDIRKIIQDERKVTFQGVEVTVNKVFNDTILDNLSPELLRKLMCNKNIEIGKSLTNSVYHKTVDFYAHRSLCRCITLNIEKHKDAFLYFKHDLNTNSTAVERDDIIITTDTASVFDEICTNNTKANVHWFLSNNYHAHIVWKQSHGSIETIMKYVEKGSHKDFTYEVKTLKDIQEKVVIVNAGPGMGKSTLLSHLAINTKRLHPNIWVVNINLLDHINLFSEWKDAKVNVTLVEAIKIVYTSTLNIKENLSEIFKKNVFELITVSGNEICFSDHYKNIYLPGVDLSEIILLNHFYNNDSLAVLLDGFDEISPDYSNEVIQLLITLKNSRVAHLWITSRPCNMLKQLELALGTMSFSLNSLKINEQKMMLQNVWSKMLGDTVDYTSVSYFYDITIKTNYHDDAGQKFASLPLHLYMMAKVFENCFRGFLKKIISLREFRDTSNLITLYETFTNIKFFDIRFGEKKLTMNTKDPDVRKMIDKERKLFIKNHKMTAAYLLLDKSIFLSDNDMTDVQEFIDSVNVSDEKSEIIECIISNNPKFVHFTFAEYFAVEHFFDKLRSVHATSSMWKYFTEQLLISDRFMGIRRFINSKLQIDAHLLKDLQRTEVYNTEFHNVVAEFDINLRVALNEKLDEIVIFILKCAKPFLHKRNICDFLKMLRSDRERYCVFCSAIGRGTRMLIRCLIDLVIDIDKKKLKELVHCQSTGECVPVFLNLSLTDTITGISLLGNYFPDLLFEVLTMPIRILTKRPSLAHSLGTNGHQLRYIYDYLQEESNDRLLHILSVTDLHGQTPLHYAALENDYDFFMKMHELLEEEKFRVICTTPDKLGFTPICMFSYHKPNFNKLKTLLEIVYQDPGIEVKDFVFTKLLKLYPKDISLFSELNIDVSGFFKTKRIFTNPGPKHPPKTPIGLLATYLGH
ncbi:unnamed protein product [Arctia plantaginis]|uniref:NACHT domain-containing protein n=1 Tax=Arctia plantaginis TaxID=874455 RepID=A0A8S0ZCI7_ARCPL|nr:unnamed protein product [Arctia plantaginis]CAB3234326.1 unnamed protein product [Arctia plantaginis]